MGGYEVQAIIPNDLLNAVKVAATKYYGVQKDVLDKLNVVNVWSQLVNGTNWVVRAKVGDQFYWADLFQDKAGINLENAYTYQFENGRFRKQIFTPRKQIPQQMNDIIQLSPRSTILGGWSHSAIDNTDLA